MKTPTCPAPSIDDRGRVPCRRTGWIGAVTALAASTAIPAVTVTASNPSTAATASTPSTVAPALTTAVGATAATVPTASPPTPRRAPDASDTNAADGLPTATAAAPPSPAQQRRLDAAVADHAAGRLREAEAAFVALAREGVPAADYDLALMALEGERPGVGRDDARRRLERAAGAGFVTAQLLLAQSLETGGFGGPADLVAAHRWYARAAATGSSAAQTAMGTAHYLGRGLPRDAARAARWFRRAALGGDEGAMYLLASMLESGDGVARDLRLARYWYARAADAGDVAAAAKAAALDRDAALPAAPPAPSTVPASPGATTRP